MAALLLFVPHVEKKNRGVSLVGLWGDKRLCC